MHVFIVSISDEMQEALLYFPQISDIHPSAKIDDLSLIKDIVAKFGYKMRIVPHPNVDQKEEIVSSNRIELNSKQIFCQSKINFK